MCRRTNISVVSFQGLHGLGSGAGSLLDDELNVLSLHTGLVNFTFILLDLGLLARLGSLDRGLSLLALGLLLCCLLCESVGLSLLVEILDFCFSENDVAVVVGRLEYFRSVDDE